MTHSISAKQVFTGERWLHDVNLTIGGSCVEKLVSEQSSVQYSSIIVPGFIDIQVNGGGGVLFNQNATVEGLRVIASAHTKFGTTALLPTLITDELNVIQKAAHAVSQAIEQKVPGIIGIHFEGPHLSVAKRGVHKTGFIRQLSDDELDVYTSKDIGIRILTIAPENVTPEQIKHLVEEGVIVCLGHSNADYDQVQSAIEAGATGFTHLYNAMSPFTSREPGMVGAALDCPDSYCGLILDGHHVHPVAAKLAYKLKGPSKLCLVTDAMSPVGTDQQKFEFFEGEVIRQGDRLNDLSGALAGSVLDMASAVRYCTEKLNLPLEHALRMASSTPADFLSLSHKGRLAPECDADFVVLDQNLNVTSTWIGGQCVYQKQ